MADPLSRLRQFFAELKRRNVYKVAVTYAVVAFVVWQVASLLFPALRFPEWTIDFVIVLTLLGFPVALVIAWAFEVTPEGVRRTPEAERAEEGASKAGGGLSTGYKVLVGIGLVGAAVAGGWYLTGGGDATVSDRSVAVLPFEAQGQEEPGPFTAGMHAALSSRLGNVSALRVSPSRAVQAFEDTALSTAEIAGELGVAWMVTGNVQTTEDEVQVIVELVDPRTGTQRWSDEYTRDLTTEGLFDLQSEISREIAQSLEAELTPEERERIDRHPTEDLDAYKLYVRGRRQLDRRREEGLQNALDYFQRAIERDSSYALAWSGLADAIGLYPLYGSDSVPSSLPEQEEAARRAVELDPDLAEPRASMGFVHTQQQNGPAALRELRRAVELKPSYAQGQHWLGWINLRLGRLQEAQEHLSVAVELNPQHWAARSALVFALVADDVERARTHFRQLSQSPERFTGVKAIVLYHAGAWSELERFAREKLGGSGASAYLARIAVRRGDTVTAREQLGQLRQSEGSDGRYVAEGLVHAVLGERDAAFEAWRKVESWDGLTSFILRYWFPDVMDPLRDDPRYQELIRRANQEWGLNPDGSIPDSVDVSFEVQSDE